MDGFWLPLVTLAAFGVILGGFVWLAHRVRTRGIGGGVMGPIQDMWDPLVYRPQIEIEKQIERKAETPSPGDLPWADDQPPIR